MVNGIKIDTAEFKTMAESLLKLMRRIGLSSLTFLKHISTQDLRTFIVALGNPTRQRVECRVLAEFCQGSKNIQHHF